MAANRRPTGTQLPPRAADRSRSSGAFAPFGDARAAAQRPNETPAGNFLARIASLAGIASGSSVAARNAASRFTSARACAARAAVAILLAWRLAAGDTRLGTGADSDGLVAQARIYSAIIIAWKPLTAPASGSSAASVTPPGFSTEPLINVPQAQGLRPWVITAIATHHARPTGKQTPSAHSNSRPRAARIAYAELRCKTNFSFLEGASHPDELVYRAAELGYAALAITDRHSVAGVVRAHIAAKQAGLKLLIGAEVAPLDAPAVVLWAADRAAYGRLTRLLTRRLRSAPKGECRLTFNDLADHAEGLLAGVIGAAAAATPAVPAPATAVELARYRELFSDRCYLLAELHRGSTDERDLEAYLELARKPICRWSR